MKLARQSMLSELLKDIVDVSTDNDVLVLSMTQDSREVSEGSLFIALKGGQQHGMAYAELAEKQGAVAIIRESDDQLVIDYNISIPVIEVKDLREYLGLIADRFYASPSKKLNVVGITGTDGKTSVSHFLAQSISDSAVIGTIGVGALKSLKKATHTTPDVIKVHEHLADLKDQQIETVAMEVSSHALDQNRVANVQFDVAVLTNLSRDHLDYHGTLEAYADAKEKLFHWDGLKQIVVNLDDEFGNKIAQKVGGVLGYGIGAAQDYPEGSLIAENTHFTSQGLSADIHYQNQTGRLEVSVLGRFNLSNLLAALGAMLGVGMSLEEGLEHINQVHTVAGRMEKVADADVLAVVDYAHTPNALETVLKALREHTENKLICVFGCGGDRDAGKRPLMAKVAEQNANVVIVTDDNPRTENPEKIVADIVKGFANPEEVVIQHDRATAIDQALRQAQRGDTVLIAGKGHENVQILATGSIPFSDREQANRVLQELAA